ncbi:MAG: hypothetical protein ACE5Q6_18780 [Dehalococcoidia bacterium]
MNEQTQSTPMALCPVCQLPLSLRPAQGRKSGKTSLMLICPQDGRHFRGFISDRAFVDQLLARLKGQTPGVEGVGDLNAIPSTDTRSKTNLERANE